MSERLKKSAVSVCELGTRPKMLNSRYCNDNACACAKPENRVFCTIRWCDQKRAEPMGWCERHQTQYTAYVKAAKAPPHRNVQLFVNFLRALRAKHAWNTTSKTMQDALKWLSERKLPIIWGACPIRDATMKSLKTRGLVKIEEDQTSANYIMMVDLTDDGWLLVQEKVVLLFPGEVDVVR